MAHLELIGNGSTARFYLSLRPVFIGDELETFGVFGWERGRFTAIWGAKGLTHPALMTQDGDRVFIGGEIDVRWPSTDDEQPRPITIPAGVPCISTDYWHDFEPHIKITQQNGLPKPEYVGILFLEFTKSLKFSAISKISSIFRNEFHKNIINAHDRLYGINFSLLNVRKSFSREDLMKIIELSIYGMKNAQHWSMYLYGETNDMPASEKERKIIAAKLAWHIQAACGVINTGVCEGIDGYPCTYNPPWWPMPAKGLRSAKGRPRQSDYMCPGCQVDNRRLLGANRKWKYDKKNKRKQPRRSN